MIQAIETSITTKKATHRRSDLTATAAAALLRFDEQTGQLHWLANHRGRVRAGTRAGCEIFRKGKSAGRVVTIEGVRYREHHVAHLLQHGTWPTAKRKAKRTRKPSTPAPIETPIAVITQSAITRNPVPTPIAVPRQLPELSRAVIAAAKPAHRGFLAGLARHFAR